MNTLEALKEILKISIEQAKLQISECKTDEDKKKIQDISDVLTKLSEMDPEGALTVVAILSVIGPTTLNGGSI